MPLRTSLLLIPATLLFAQAPNSQPNAHEAGVSFGTLPAGRTMGSSSAIEIDRDGKSVWVAERCGQNNCAGKSEAPVLKFDKNGKLLKSFGENLFIFPHGLYVDKKGNVWVVDGQGRDGKGHQVTKFSPDGKILMTLGKAGVAGETNDTFNQPSDVIEAPDGHIFVADGHGPRSNARIVKFDATGKFVKAWGTHGTGPGQFNTPHGLAFDSKGRLFVADRGNNRIQIFDQEGKFLEEWKQFSRPSGIYIDKNDNIYVSDSESTAKEGYGHNPGWKRGIRIGSAKDGTVREFIPDPSPGLTVTTGGEGVTVDKDGVVYAAEVGERAVKRYAPKKK